ncbi:MAG: methyltransferase domain-containing protein [Chloroflexi bacterium]|nr:methyltransferase domain-containing protein [Chloroflexota bacterium]
MTIQATNHTKAIRLGHPSYVWRRGQDRRMQQIREFVELRGKRILDIGCGMGMYVSRLRQYSNDVYGVDVDPEKIAEASSWLPNLKVAPGELLPFEDNTFDVILLNEVIEHVEDDQKTIQEAYRLLVPGGHIVIYAPNRLYPFETHGFYFAGKYYFRLLPVLANWVPDFVRNYFAPHVRIYTRASIRQLFKGLDARFVVESHIFPGLDNWAERGLVGRIFRDLMHAAESSPLRAFGISHFVVVQKPA